METVALLVVGYLPRANSPALSWCCYCTKHTHCNGFPSFKLHSQVCMCCTCYGGSLRLPKTADDANLMSIQFGVMCLPLWSSWKCDDGGGKVKTEPETRDCISIKWLLFGATRLSVRFSSRDWASFVSKRGNGMSIARNHFLHHGEHKENNREVEKREPLH